MGGCFRGCLMIVLALILLPLLPLLILGAVVYGAVRLLLGLWRSERPLRTKRALTGVLFYPAAVYFMYRYTRYPPKLKHAFMATAIAATIVIFQAAPLLLPVVALLGAAFLALFMAGSTDYQPAPARVTVTPAPTRPSARAEVPTADLRRLLEIEESREASERRLLLAREFDRLASEVCGPAPLDRASWPDYQRLTILREEIDLLRASAADTPPALPAPGQDELALGDLRAAIDSLRDYAGMMVALEGTPRGEPEQLRQLARERGRIQGVQEELMRRLQGL